MTESANMPGSAKPTAGGSTVRQIQTTLREALAMARTALTEGRLGEAEELFQQIHRAAPRNVEAAINYSIVLMELKRLPEALAMSDAAVAAGPGSSSAYHVRACILTKLGRHDDAVANFRRALEIRPTFAEAWRNLANGLVRQNKLDEAVQAVCRSLDFEGGHTGPIIDLGDPAQRRELSGRAETVLRAVVAARPDSYGPLANLGSVVCSSGNHDEAIELFRKACVLRPDLADAHANLGDALSRRGLREEAINALDKALELDPSHALAHFLRSLVLLRLGRLDEGWKDYLWRWKWRYFRAMHAGVRFETPVWDGSPLAGKRILLGGEQGFGDFIQFIRYVPMVVQRGGRVVLQERAPLTRLLARVEGVHEVVPGGEHPADIEAHCPIMNLPALFGITLDTVPANVPYLSPYPEDAAVWRQRLEGERRLKVALVWAGNPHHSADAQRSMDVTLLNPLLRNEEAAFYSIQVGRNGDLDRLGDDRMRVTDLAPHLKDFAETAAAIEQMDLVIGVDTAVIHLTGALAKLAWLMLPVNAEWRWMDDRDDSPWYPTMRIFRQTAKGDWEGVIARLGEALRQRVSERHRA